MHWNIRRHGQPITIEQYRSLPEAPLELLSGYLYASEEDRLALLGALLQNVGVEAAVRLGDLAVWREAIETRQREES